MISPRRVFLINQYFYPDMAATAQLLGDLAGWLGSAGWQVVVFAGRGGYARAGKAMERESGRVWNGVSVRRVWCTDFGRRHVLGRLCDYVSFIASVAVAVALSRRADVVICLSTPPFLTVLGIIARLMGSRVVYKVEDLYPDVAIALSTLREKSLLAILLLKLSQFLLRRADCVVALDEAMTGRLHKAGARSIETIPNWADGTAIRPDRQSGRTFQDTEGLSGKFIVLYSGNLGLVHRFDAVVEAAKQCAIELPNVLFLFVGNGARWTEVQQASIGLSNVRFMDYLPREKLRALYNAADVHLIALCDEVAGLLFPSKYPAALAAGKPVLLVGGSGAPFREEIRKRELGRVCPHEASVIVRAIRDMAESPHKREFMGRNARRVFEARYSKAIALQRWEHVLNCVVQGEQIPTQVIEEIQGPAVFEERNACSAPPL